MGKWECVLRYAMVVNRRMHYYNIWLVRLTDTGLWDSAGDARPSAHVCTQGITGLLYIEACNLRSWRDKQSSKSNNYNINRTTAVYKKIKPEYHGKEMLGLLLEEILAIEQNLRKLKTG